LHVERLTSRGRQILYWVDQYKPDLILYSGDVFSYSNVNEPVAHRQAKELLSGLEAPLGVYAVLGSPPVDVPEVIIPFYDKLSVRLLLDEVVALECAGQKIRLLGLTCSHNPERDAPKLKEITNGNGDAFDILLYHSPDLAPLAVDAGIDIQFSGHTHGGQVRLPVFGALFTSSIYGKKFESGRFHLKDMTLYVTRGVGLEGRGAPRVRFLCPPECSIWDIYF
jgi:hypothetical protein